MGTLSGPTSKTDANGLASIGFVGTAVPVANPFFPSTVTATSPSGNVNFIITTALGADNGHFIRRRGGFVNPPQTNLNLTAASGSTLAGGVVVRVGAQAGPQIGRPGSERRSLAFRTIWILRIRPPPAVCNGPNGLVLTDSNGLGTCDLVITGPARHYQLTAVVGEYQTPLLSRCMSRRAWRAVLRFPRIARTSRPTAARAP